MLLADAFLPDDDETPQQVIDSLRDELEEARDLYKDLAADFEQLSDQRDELLREIKSPPSLLETVSRLLPVNEEADRRAEEFEAERRREADLYACPHPGCEEEINCRDENGQRWCEIHLPDPENKEVPHVAPQEGRGRNPRETRERARDPGGDVCNSPAAGATTKALPEAPATEKNPAGPAGEDGGEAEPSGDDAHDPESRAPQHSPPRDGGTPEEEGLPLSDSSSGGDARSVERVRSAREAVDQFLNAIEDKSTDGDW